MDVIVAEEFEDSLYATNGHVLLCVRGARSAEFPFTVQAQRHAPTAATLAGMVAEVVKWPRAVDRLLTTQEVSSLVGRASSLAPCACPDCDGLGRHECSCGDNHECGACSGSGKIQPSERADPVRVAGRLHVDRRLLRAWWPWLPARESYDVAIGSLNSREAQDCTLAIRGDGCFLVVMGVRPNGEQYPDWPGEVAITSTAPRILEPSQGATNCAQSGHSEPAPESVPRVQADPDFRAAVADAAARLQEE